MDIQEYGKSILSQTIGELKGEYDQIPQSVKDVMPDAALLIAEGAVTGTLDGEKSSRLKKATAIMKNVKVGGQIALQELMLEKAADILGAGLKFVRKVVFG